MTVITEDLLEQQCLEWHRAEIDRGAIKVVMTGSASDRELLQPHIYNKLQKKTLEKRFKGAHHLASV